jgi:hypothetical protein
VEVGSEFITGGEAHLNTWSQAKGAFDDVSDPAEAGSVGFATTCDAVLDAANGNRPAVLVEVDPRWRRVPGLWRGRPTRPRMGCSPVARSGRQSSAEGRSPRAGTHGEGEPANTLTGGCSARERPLFAASVRRRFACAHIDAVAVAGRACRASGSRDEDGFRSLPAPGTTARILYHRAHGYPTDGARRHRGRRPRSRD